jgi:hypothetical protein
MVALLEGRHPQLAGVTAGQELRAIEEMLLELFLI